MLAKAQGELKDNDEDESSESDSDDSEPYGDSDNEKEESDDDLIEDTNIDSKSVDDDDLGFVDKKPRAASAEDMEETKD